MMGPPLLSRVASRVSDWGQEESEGIFQHLRKNPETIQPAPTRIEVPPKHLPEVKGTRAQLLFMF